MTPTMSESAKKTATDNRVNRRGFGLRQEVKAQIKKIYSSDIIKDIKKEGFKKRFGRLEVFLAKEFGFCYGVDRAVGLAYETVQNFPSKRIYLTNEIIHNPSVNKNLAEMGVKFLSGPYKTASLNDIHQDDIVIVPAFGATIEELKQLKATGCLLVDTICGSVINVWKRVEKYAGEGFTSIIHGKYYHEETMATSSQVLQFPGGHYLILLDKEEAAFVCNYIEKGGNREAFLKKFEHATSPGFDPDKHLSRLGLANQTTMLSSESFQIAKMFERALENKFGTAEIDQHYRSFDTICSATQERQDAIISMRDDKLDLIIVIGGYNSSNTAHLHKIAAQYAPSYHIDSADSVIDATRIRHKPVGQKEEIVTRDWLPNGFVRIGITSGASTPNNITGEVLEKLIGFCGDRRS